jgi:hypothetical protein
VVAAVADVAVPPVAQLQPVVRNVALVVVVVVVVPRAVVQPSILRSWIR